MHRVRFCKFEAKREEPHIKTFIESHPETPSLILEDGLGTREYLHRNKERSHWELGIQVVEKDQIISEDEDDSARNNEL